MEPPPAITFDDVPAVPSGSPKIVDCLLMLTRGFRCSFFSFSACPETSSPNKMVTSSNCCFPDRNMLTSRLQLAVNEIEISSKSILLV